MIVMEIRNYKDQRFKIWFILLQFVGLMTVVLQTGHVDKVSLLMFQSYTSRSFVTAIVQFAKEMQNNAMKV